MGIVEWKRERKLLHDSSAYIHWCYMGIMEKEMKTRT